MGNEKEYLRTQRVECAGCHMFEWGHKTVQKNGQHYHGGCLKDGDAEVRETRNKAPMLYLIGLEERGPMFAEEQCAA